MDITWDFLQGKQDNPFDRNTVHHDRIRQTQDLIPVTTTSYLRIDWIVLVHYVVLFVCLFLKTTKSGDPKTPNNNIIFNQVDLTTFIVIGIKSPLL